MDDLLTGFWSDLVARVHGPFSFRFVLQPLMGLIYATRDGIVDAGQGRPPYFWSVLFKQGSRMDLLREGWKAELRVIVLGVVMDVIYQLMEFRTVHPFQLIVIVLLLAFVPYVLARGPISRIAKAWMSRNVGT